MDTGMAIFEVFAYINKYSAIIGVVISIIFIFVFVKSFCKKNSELKTPFYVFTIIGTAFDFLSRFLMTLQFYLEPLVEESEDESIIQFYGNWVYPIVLFTTEIIIILDTHFDVILTINRLTAFVFPIIHKKVRSFSYFSVVL